MYDSVFSPYANFRAKVPKYVKPQSIKLNLNRLESGGATAIKNAFSRAVTKALKDLEKAIARKDGTAISSYKFSATPELEQSILGMWLGGWNLGGKHGKNELTPQLKASFDEDLLDAEWASIENVQAQTAINNRANTLAKDISSSQWEKIRGHILSAVQPSADTGEPISRSELLKRINGELGESGFGKRAEKIARTELTFAYNAGRLQTYKDSGLVSHVVFLSILDDRRCKICEERHGMTIALSDVEVIAANTPPMHVNCRCVLSPRLATPENRQEIDNDAKKSRKRLSKFDTLDIPPKWLAAGILAAILLSRKSGRVAVRELSNVALAAQVQAIANATGESLVAQQARVRRRNQITPIPSQGVIEVQPRVVVNGLDLNTATPEEIREALRDFLKSDQIDSLIEFLADNPINSVDDLLAAKGFSKKSKAFKVLKDLADRDKLVTELQQVKSASELWLKNWGLSRSEAKTIFEEINNKPVTSWKELQQRLKKRGISSDKIQRAIDKIKSLELEEQRQVVGLDDFVDLLDDDDFIDQPTVEPSRLIKQREATEQRRREALQEIKELEQELQQLRSDESRFNVRIRRMSKRNPKEFITQEEIKIKNARQARLQRQIETAQQKTLELNRQLERAKLALNQLDIPNLTPEAKNRTQTVENLGLEGTQLSNAVDNLTQSVQSELDVQMGKGFNSPKRSLTNLEKTVNRTAVNLSPARELIEQTNLEALQDQLEAIEESYQRLSDPLYPDNYFGRDTQNQLTSIKAELRKTKAEIDIAVRSLSRNEQQLSTATTQTEQQLGRMRLLKVGAQLEKQAQELDNQLRDYGQRVKRTENFEKTVEPFSPDRQQPLEQMGQQTTEARQRIPSYRREVESQFRPTIDNAKAQLSEIAQQKERLQALQKQVDSTLERVQKLPISKAQIPDADSTAYNASVELRKLSREIQEETKRFKTLAGANRVNLDENIKTQNRTFQEYEKQRFGDERTPGWEQNVSPAVEARLTQIDNSMKKLEAIAQDWNLGYLADLGQYVDVGVDEAGKVLRVRRWLDDNGLLPEDLSLSTGSGRKVGYEAIRELADETIRQMAIVKGSINKLREDTQFKAFTDRGAVKEADYLKWAENQATYWQQQQKKATSENWQGSSYERLDKLNKSIDSAKASDATLRKSITSDDAQGQLRRTVAKYQDWQRKYTNLKDTGLEGTGLRQIDDAQRRLIVEQESLLEQADRYVVDAQGLIEENAQNAREMWEKIRRDSQQPVFFDVKGKAVERGQLLKQLDEIDNKLTDYRKMQEIRIEPLTYSRAASPLVKERGELNEKLTQLQPQIQQLQSQIDELKQAKRGTKKLETQLSKLRLEEQNTQSRLTDVIQEIRDLRLPPQNYQQLQTLKQQLAETQKQITQIQTDMASSRRELEALRSQPLGGSSSGIARQNRVDALEDAIARRNNDLFKVVGELNQLRKEIGDIRNASRNQ